MATNKDLYSKIKAQVKHLDIVNWLKDCDHTNIDSRPSDGAYRFIIKKCAETYRKLGKKGYTEKGAKELEEFMNSPVQFPVKSAPKRQPKLVQLPCSSSTSNCSYRNVSVELAAEVKTLTNEKNALLEELEELKSSKISKKTLKELKTTMKNQEELVKVLQNRIKMKDKTLKKVRIQNQRCIKKITKLTDKVDSLMET